ncbi:MAG TPA: GH116 family glycosyl-hydrolase [Candidatus Hydrogenedentes bacterium]|nr:GH116 family glycosyl-hydrolase [Candidatus Hydrogenedentota bacterium]
MRDKPAPADTPPFLALGGVGAGYVRVSPDGSWSPVAPPGMAEGADPGEMRHGFLALSVRGKSGRYLRRLRADDAPPGGLPPALARNCFSFRSLFPRGEFRLNDPASPVELRWTWFSPLVPFDHDASCMPAVLLRLHIGNVTREKLECALALNLETPAPDPERALAGIQPVTADYTDGLLQTGESFREAGDAGAGAPPRNALLFTPDADPARAAGGLHTCLAARARKATVSTAVWDPAVEGAPEKVWGAFADDGVFPPGMRGGEGRCGALSCRLDLKPGEEAVVWFVHTWHANTAGPGGGAPCYARLWRNALETARHALRHADYFHKAVTDWHLRFFEGAPSPWLAKALADSVRWFVVRGGLSAAEVFSWSDDQRPEAEPGPETAFLRSYPLALFLPRFEAATLARRLRGFASERQVDVRTASSPLLSAWRDYLLTGNLAHLQELWPSLSALLDGALARAESRCAGLGGKECGVWMAALRAGAHIAEALRDAARLRALLDACTRVRTHFETAYWDEAQGTYREEGAEQRNAADVLRGPWTAMILRMDDIVQPERVARTVASLRALPAGVRLSQRALVSLACMERLCGDEGPKKGYWVRRLMESVQLAAVQDPRLFWPFFLVDGGLLYAAPFQRLYLFPQAAETPGAEVTDEIMTPLCFGRLSFSETGAGKKYAATLKVALDSPQMVREIVARVPAGVPAVTAECLLYGDSLACAAAVRGEEARREAVITLRHPLQLAGELCVRLRGAEPPEAPEAPARLWRRRT